MCKIKDKLSKDQDEEFEMWIGYEDYLMSIPEPTDQELSQMEEDCKDTSGSSIADRNA